MNKTYQPQVIELCKQIVESLIDSGFFTENEITDNTPAYPVLCDFLTEKFIIGDLNNCMINLTDEESMKLLKMIGASCVLNSLKKKGFINSCEDENGEDIFFLSKNAEKFLK
jgi:hypothetical protein